MSDPTKPTDATRSAVRDRYAEAARTAAAGEKAACGPSGQEGCGCGSGRTARDTGGGSLAADPITANLYDAEESAELPEKALAASLGCGNPTALAELREGEVVLDLGSGGGVDVLLSARRVGPTGMAYGVDMTDEMLELARENAREAGVDNVEFLKGEIEDLPLPDASVDVILSNCVINLSTDKARVLREAARVLRPGGRFAVSDIVVRGPVPGEIRRSMELWIGCVAGALEEDEYRTLLEEAGFVDVDVEPTRIYRAEDAEGFLREAGLDPESAAEAVDGRIMAAFVRARKPESPS
ncbi:MAG: arsenite methyltransferase [Gemmatimonadota bacterium]